MPRVLLAASSGKTWVSEAVLAFSFLTGVLLLAQQPSPDLALDEAATAFEQGKTAEAEQKQRPILEKHPSNLRALLLAGAILDTGGRYTEADGYYERALKIAPGSAELLNNAANHYLASGNRRPRTRILFEGRRHRSAASERQSPTGADERGGEARPTGGRLSASSPREYRSRHVRIAGVRPRFKWTVLAGR